MEEESIKNEEEDHEDRSRPTTPKWWRPSHPPETYLWEEMRRKRKRGGYPWTLLDKDEDDDDDYGFGDNLYEPVNPPPLYATGSGYMNKDHAETSSLDERMSRMIDIPPDIEIVNSDGLDGLDLPENDMGVDGDREWRSFHRDHDDYSQQGSQKATFTAGIRNKELPKYGETSSVRPLANKTLSFSPDVPPDEASITTEQPEQEVPTVSDEFSGANEEVAEASGGKPASALEQLKTRAGQMKQRLSKISLPVRPKFNRWTGIKLNKKKKRNGKSPQDEDQDQSVPDVEEVGGWTQPMSLVPETERSRKVPTTTTTTTKTTSGLPSLSDIDRDFFQGSNTENLVSDEEEKEEEEEVKAVSVVPVKAVEDVETKKRQEDEVKRQKVEEKLQKDDELKRLRAEEKAQKDKEMEELKRLKEEVRLRKEKEQEAIKKAKEEERLNKLKEQEEQKRFKAEEKLRKEKEKLDMKKQMDEIKRAKEEKLRKAKQDQDITDEADRAEEEMQQNAIDDHSIEDEMVVQGVDKGLFKKPPRTPEEKKRKLIDIDFTKRFKRSKTPPGRPEPPKIKFTRGQLTGDSTSNKLAEQYSQELQNREEEMQQEDSSKLREPQIYITQPSVESSDTASDIQQSIAPPQPQPPISKPKEPVQTEKVKVVERDEEEEVEEEPIQTQTTKSQKGKENLDKFGKKLKGFGVKSKAIAAQTSKNFGKTMKGLGHGIKEFGVNAVQEVKAKQEAIRQKEAQRKAELEENLDDAYVPAVEEPRRQTFKFKKQERPSTSASNVGESGMVIEEQPAQLNVVQKSPEIPPRPSSGRRIIGRSNSASASDGKRSQRKFEDEEDKFVHRSQLLGRADRDWESPIDLIESRDASEEPFHSENVSSHDSPPGSSMASSSAMMHHGRGRQGVLEEIDSDEFFLRERGISEGEDEEEVNRFLVEELRQAFRPTMSNALTGFDLPSPPSRPGRNPKKPPRKEKASVSSNNFQTFPPERPKRKHIPGYISSYINANADDGHFQGEEDEEQGKIIEEEGEGISFQEEEEDEVLRRVKEELRKIDQDLEEDDGRYEPVNEGDEGQGQPIKPQRSRRKKPKLPPGSPQTFYYNTIAANEWMRDLENEIEPTQMELTLVDDTQQKPVAPKRERVKSGKSGGSSSRLAPEIDDSEIHFVDDEENDETLQASLKAQNPPLAQAESEGRLQDDEDFDDTLDDVDESGYAVVHKDTRNEPKTFPRKKKKRNGSSGSSKGNSLKRRSIPRPVGNNNNNISGSTPTTNGTNAMFFSLPRHTPRTFHIVPPTRPHRTYSTLRPKRPPRTKSKSNKNLSNGQGTTADYIPPPSSPNLMAPRPTTPASPGSRHEDRPSTAIGIMQGRPLPPPPRPPERMNDLDRASIERLCDVNMRHYVNYDDDEDPIGIAPVQEELCTAKNIPLLTQPESGDSGGRDIGEIDSILANSEINVAVQTDPIHDEDFELNIAAESFEEEDERIEQKRSSATYLPSYDQQRDEQIPPPIPDRPRHRTEQQPPQQLPPPQQPQSQPIAAPPVPPQVVFPTSLHLHELEVDILRVNDLTANILSLEQLRAPHLELNSLSATSIQSRGPLSVPSIHSPNLSVENLDCQRCDAPIDLGSSIPPPSFYNLSSPSQQQQRTAPSQCTEEDYLKDNHCESTEQEELDSSCPCPNLHASVSVEEESQSSPPSSPPSVVVPTTTRISSVPTGISRTSSADPDLEDIAHLSVRLGRALLRVTVRSLHAMAEYVEMAASNDPHCQEQQRGNMQVLLCLLLILVAGIILVGRSASVEPRWQYFLPPGDM